MIFLLQFVNKISEKLLGYKIDEIIGRIITDVVIYDNFVLMEQHISKGREFEGNMNCKRKNNQMITISCRVIPFCITSRWVDLNFLISIVFRLSTRLFFRVVDHFPFRKPTHYIYIYDTTYLSENIGALSPSPSQIGFQRTLVAQRRMSDLKSNEGVGGILTLSNYFPPRLCTLVSEISTCSTI